MPIVLLLLEQLFRLAKYRVKSILLVELFMQLHAFLAIHIHMMR